jgi:hypothetical protein
LYEKHGHKWDYIAWKARTSQIGRAEIMHEVYAEAGRKGSKLSRGTLGYKYTPEQCKRMSDAHIGQVPWNKGISTPQEIKDKISSRWTPERRKAQSERMRAMRKKQKTPAMHLEVAAAT